MRPRTHENLKIQYLQTMKESFYTYRLEENGYLFLYNAATDKVMALLPSSSRPLQNRCLTFIVDGFDILGQLSGVTRSINAQRRTETFRNVLPSYFMAHAVYHLNIKPKKDRD